MVQHIDINTLNEYTICNDVKVGGNLVTKAYFTRNFTMLSPNPVHGWIVAKFNDGSRYILTHDQTCVNDEVYIVDTVNGVVPTDLADLSAKLALLLKF